MPTWVSGLAFALAAVPHPEWGPLPPVAPFGLAPLPAARVVKPMIFPVAGASRWKDGYGSLREGYRHTGIDVRAPKMTPVVAPFAGVIGLKRESFWIVGDDGWTVLGTHLNDDNPGKHDHKASRDLMFAPDLAPGDRVRAGQLVGYVGESGNATGPHLHFELYAPGPGPTMGRLRNPAPSLHMAQRLAAPRAFASAACPAKGRMRLQACVRKVDAAKGQVTVILLSKGFANGRTVRVAHPRYVRLRLPAGFRDYGALRRLGAATPVGLLVPASARLDGARVSKVLIPMPQA